jgi:hypothetical protein
VKSFGGDDIVLSGGKYPFEIWNVEFKVFVILKILIDFKVLVILIV